MTKVTGNIVQLKVTGSMSQLEVSGNIVQGGFDWIRYWSTRYPSGLTATIISPSQIDLGWTNNGNVDYDGGSIERSDDGGIWTEIDTFTTGDIAYSDTVTADTEYSYRIRYYKGSNYSAYSNEADVMDADWATYWAAYWASLISATVEQAAPTKIIMTFSQANTSLLATDFTIAGKTITLLERDVTNKILTLTVSVAVAYGASHTITFVKTGGTAAVTNNIIYAPDIDDGDTRFLYISSIISATKGITKDGSNLVSKWADYLESGRNLLQAEGSKQPLWSANGVLADGIDNFMQCVAFTWNQPEFIYMVFKQVTWTYSDVLFDGNTIGFRGQVYQVDNTPGLKAYAGTASAQNSNLAVNTWGIIRCLFNGASSKFIINDTAPVTGNFGSNNMGGFTLGSWYVADALYSNIEVKEIIGRKSVLGEAAIYAYLAAKYGI